MNELIACAVMSMEQRVRRTMEKDNVIRWLEGREGDDDGKDGRR